MHQPIEEPFDNSHRATRKKAEMPNLTIHNFRHTFANLALQSGSDVGAVSKLLGHSSIRVTMEIYHHLNPDHARNVIENLPIKLSKSIVEEEGDTEEKHV
ncbi:tyrosine-type recombinase/integrase [bacterium]|nr:tyrosine-type recombinase/integrase [candidate division CSSED10-310 bacterium]